MSEIIIDKFENRNRLLKYCTEKGMTNHMILQIVEPMRGKSDEEKEAIAEAALKKLLSENDTSAVDTDTKTAEQ